MLRFFLSLSLVGCTATPTPVPPATGACRSVVPANPTRAWRAPSCERAIARGQGGDTTCRRTDGEIAWVQRPTPDGGWTLTRYLTVPPGVVQTETYTDGTLALLTLGQGDAAETLCLREPCPAGHRSPRDPACLPCRAKVVGALRCSDHPTPRPPKCADPDARRDDPDCYTCGVTDRAEECRPGDPGCHEGRCRSVWPETPARGVQVACCR